MGEDWRAQVDKSYQKWKYSEMHGELKSYFNTVQTSSYGEPFKKESKPLHAGLSELKETMTCDHKKRVISKNSDDNTVEFLNVKIDVGEEEEEEVDKYCQETILGGFWKTMTKLCDTAYLVLKTAGDVLKKLFKKLIDFFAAGMQSCVLAIGHAIAKIVAWAHPLPDYEVHDETGVLFVPDLKFFNYGETVANMPKYTFFPKNIDEVQKVIQFAKAQGKRLRCAGMKHSWSEMFSNNGEILVYLLPLSVTDTISFARFGIGGMEEEIENWGSELNGIEVIEELEGGEHALVKVGTATTNLQMLNWSNKSGWTLPADIIAVMITYGGSNAMLCHGSGLATQTLSDMVFEMELIDANGELRVINDKNQLKAFAGCFGLAGIVTSITFKMDKMTWAKFHPKKTRMADSIPRPDGDTNSEAYKKMVDLCTNSYYVEFFWFPNRGTEDGYWENCWTNDGLEEEAIDINSSLDDDYQVATTYMFEVIMKILQPMTMLTKEEYYDEKTNLRECLRYLFTKVVSMAGVNALPAPDCHQTTSLVEALHFRRGFHYIAVREMEMEIPIPSLPNGDPDWNIVSRAWWDAVDLIEKSAADGVFAVDMALELRVMGGSEMLMAPQYGNKHGTLAIEPVSTRIVHKEVWEDFKVSLANIWMNYTDYDGSILKSRVHWAKESPRSVTVRDQTFDTIEYWHKIYDDSMTQFFDTLADNGVSIEDTHKLFGNHYLDSLFKPHWERFGIKISSSDREKENGMNANGTEMENGYKADGTLPEGQKADQSTCCVIV